MEPTFIFLDFEFTTFERNQAPKGFYHEVIEIGLLKVKGDNIIDQESSLVTPVDFPQLSEKAMELTGINQEEVQQGIGFEEMIGLIHKHYIPKETTLVTWGDMDVLALRRNCQMRKVPFPLSLMLEDWLDLSKAYQHYYGHEKTPGLWSALEFYGKADRPQTHRALDDAFETCIVYQNMIKDRWVYHNPNDINKLSSPLSELLDPAILAKLNQVK